MTETAFKLKAGKFYQTRSGAIVGPVKRRENFDTHPWQAKGSPYLYLDNGRLYTAGSGYGESDNDLVCEAASLSEAR
jgi:hypothetical protein